MVAVTAIAVIEMMVIGALKSEYTEPHHLPFLEKTEQSTEGLTEQTPTLPQSDGALVAVLWVENVKT